MVNKDTMCTLNRSQWSNRIVLIQESLANTKVNAWQHSAFVRQEMAQLWTSRRMPLTLQHSRSSKVTHFRVNEMPIMDYVLKYDNFSLGDEDLENIVSERYENRHLRRPLSCLMPHISRTPANICITIISLEITFTWLHFCCWEYGCICIQIFVVGSERQACNVIECIMAVQGHPRSLICTPIESSLSTSY